MAKALKLPKIEVKTVLKIDNQLVSVSNVRKTIKTQSCKCHLAKIWTGFVQNMTYLWKCVSDARRLTDHDLNGI